MKTVESPTLYLGPHGALYEALPTQVPWLCSQPVVNLFETPPREIAISADDNEYQGGSHYSVFLTASIPDSIVCPIEYGGLFMRISPMQARMASNHIAGHHSWIYVDTFQSFRKFLFYHFGLGQIINITIKEK